MTKTANTLKMSSTFFINIDVTARTNLYKVDGSLRIFVVLSHDVGVHECLAPEEAEAAGAAQDASHDVFGRLLEPVTDGILKHLVPHHEPGPRGKDPSASCVQRIDAKER